MGSECPNPIIVITKGNICRIVIDARLLNSCTDTEYFSWPVEALQDKLMRINGDLFCLFDLNQAFHQASMDEENMEQTILVLLYKIICITLTGDFMD